MTRIGRGRPTNSITLVNAREAPTWGADFPIMLTASNPSGSGTANLNLWINPAPPSGWQAQDVGPVAAAGSWGESGGVLSVRGSGEDIWGTYDECYFRYHSQIRATAGAGTSLNQSSWNAAPYWVRLVRSGGQITAYSSANGVTWTVITTYSLTLPNPVYVGFAVTAHDNWQLNTAVFTDPSVR